MIIDSSAIVAILLDEPEAYRLSAAMFRAPHCQISAGSWLESPLVFEGRAKPELSGMLDNLIKQFAIEILPFDAKTAEAAREANRQYGRNRHPAKLNFGDCIAYATAKLARQPLLFKGADFAQTDILAAPY